MNNHQNNLAALDGNEWNGDHNGMGPGNRQESGDDRGDDSNNHVDDGHGNQQSGHNEAGYQQEADDEDGGVEGSDDAKQGRVVSAGDDYYEMLEPEDHNGKTREPGPIEPQLSALSDC